MTNRTNPQTLYLVTFDLHRAPSPPGGLYADIYRGIKRRFGGKNFCKDFGQFCLVRSHETVDTVKDGVKAIIDRMSNRFSSRDIVVFSLGREISISRGRCEAELRDFRRFFLTSP